MSFFIELPTILIYQLSIYEYSLSIFLAHTPLSKVQLNSQTKATMPPERFKASESTSPIPNTGSEHETVFGEDVFAAGTGRSQSFETLVDNVSVKKKYCKDALAVIGEAPPALRYDLLQAGRISVKDKSRIGVLGNPGSGKSSVINALIECDNILPSGGGSTSVTGSSISLKWNDNEEWQFVGKIKYHDYDVAKDIIGSALQAYHEAAQANESLDRMMPVIVMFEALCPNIDPSYKKYTVQEIIDLCPWKSYLGNTNIIRANSPDRFREVLHAKIVSKIENSTGKWKRTLSTWPIIRGISIQLKARLLERGIKIYDMPGVNDAVPAKSAIARSTAKKCDILLAVLPTTRSASDSRTGELLSEALDHVHYAGRVNRIALVATMADKFNLAEEKSVVRSDQLVEYENLLEKAQKNVTRAELRLKDLEDMRDGSGLARLKTEIGRWATAQRQAKASEDKRAYKPEVGPNGRHKRETELSLGEIKTELDDLRKQRNAAEASAKTVLIDIKDQVETVHHYKNVVQKRQNELNMYIFRAAMSITKQELASTFVAHVQFRDEKAQVSALRASDQDVGNNLVFHDYARLQQDLPVFVISSQEFKNLTELGEPISSEFSITNIDDTGMPALAKHLYQTSATLIHDRMNTKNNDVESAFASLKIAINNDTEIQEVDPDKADAAVTIVNSILDEFTDKLLTLTSAAWTQFRAKCIRFISQKLRLKQAIVKKAFQELDKYRMTGTSNFGLRYMELKATVSRKGVWKTGTRKIDIDFNRLVKEVCDEVITVAMHQLFVSEEHHASIKRYLNGCCEQMIKELDAFKKEVFLLAANAGVSTLAMGHLERQHIMRKKSLLTIFSKAREAVAITHVVAGEELTENIQRAWDDAYKEAERITGTGATQEMFEILFAELQAGTTDGDVENNVTGMLEEPLQEWHVSMLEHIDSVDSRMAKRIVNFSHSMISDYRAAVKQRDGYSRSNKTPGFERVRQMLIAAGEDLREPGKIDEAAELDDKMSDVIETDSHNHKRKRDIMENPDIELTEESDAGERSEETEDSDDESMF